MIKFRIIKVAGLTLAVIATWYSEANPWLFLAIMLSIMALIINLEDIERDWRDAYTDELTGEEW